MPRYKCYSCMKEFDSPRNFPNVRSGGRCIFCRAMITDEINLVSGRQNRQRSKSSPAIMRAAKTVNLHNDNPLLEDSVKFSRLGMLVYRGADFPYEKMNGPFKAKKLARFEGSWIIRDKWVQKQVSTHMQTKNILAWSKSLQKALEYAYGSIQGSGIGKKGVGYFYVGWIEEGVVVLDAVRKWERENGWNPVSAGTQEEVLSDSLPKNKIVACWKISQGSSFGKVVILEKYDCSKAKVPNTALQQYAHIDALYEVEKEFDIYAL